MDLRLLLKLSSVRHSDYRLIASSLRPELPEFRWPALVITPAINKLRRSFLSEGLSRARRRYKRGSEEISRDNNKAPTSNHRNLIVNHSKPQILPIADFHINQCQCQYYSRNSNARSFGGRLNHILQYWTFKIPVNGNPIPNNCKPISANSKIFRKYATYFETKVMTSNRVNKTNNSYNS